MTHRRKHVVVVVAALLCACGDDTSYATDAASSTPDPTEQSQRRRASAQPMPRISARLDAVLSEVGSDLGQLPKRPAEAGADHRQWHRAALESLSPRARASLRRHNVRVEAVARHLEANPEQINR